MRWASWSLVFGLACQGPTPQEPAPPAPSEPPAPGQLAGALDQLATLKATLCVPLLDPAHPAFFIKALYGEVSTPFLVGERDPSGRWGRFTPLNTAGAAELLSLPPTTLDALIAPVNTLGVRRVERWGPPEAEQLALRFEDGWLVCGGASPPDEACDALSTGMWRCGPEVSAPD